MYRGYFTNMSLLRASTERSMIGLLALSPTYLSFLESFRGSPINREFLRPTIPKCAAANFGSFQHSIHRKHTLIRDLNGMTRFPNSDSDIKDIHVLKAIRSSRRISSRDDRKRRVRNSRRNGARGTKRSGFYIVGADIMVHMWVNTVTGCGLPREEINGPRFGPPVDRADAVGIGIGHPGLDRAACP